MSKKKADKYTKKLFGPSECTGKDPTTLTATWQGRVVVLDAQKSFIAKKMGFNENGEYAIKVR